MKRHASNHDGDSVEWDDHRPSASAVVSLFIITHALASALIGGAVALGFVAAVAALVWSHH